MNALIGCVSTTSSSSTPLGLSCILLAFTAHTERPNRHAVKNRGCNVAKGIPRGLWCQCSGDLVSFSLGISLREEEYLPKSMRSMGFEPMPMKT